MQCLELQFCTPESPNLKAAYKTAVIEASIILLKILFGK